VIVGSSLGARGKEETEKRLRGANDKKHFRVCVVCMYIAIATAILAKIISY